MKRALPLLGLLVAAAAIGGCPFGDEDSGRQGARDTVAAIGDHERAFLDTLQRRTFNFFWERSDSTRGLTPDRWPTRSFVSIAAVGFALTAYPIGVEHAWITRDQALERVENTLRFFWNAPQDTARSGTIGYRGLYYHFLVPETGHRFEKVELSTIDTALLLGGVLFCQSYFDRDDPREAGIRALADSIYRRVDWRWAQTRPPGISLGWQPEEGFLPWDYRGYNETMLLYLLALGSPTHPAAPNAWTFYVSGYQWGSFHGQPHFGFAPLFGHQYSHVWVDFRGIQDSVMKARGIDYFENSRRATLAQQRYAMANPSGFEGYGEHVWGLTACDGPLSGKVMTRGKVRQFDTYRGRGAAFNDIRDDGTIAPTAAGGSVPFAPEICIPTLVTMQERYGEPLFGRYGFVDAFNPTLDADVPVQHGRIVRGVGWFDTDYLGIDQGPIVAMIENYRSGLVWRVMSTNPHLIRGLRAAGFSGGWLEKVKK